MKGEGGEAGGVGEKHPLGGFPPLLWDQAWRKEGARGELGGEGEERAPLLGRERLKGPRRRGTAAAAGGSIDVGASLWLDTG